MNKALFLDRDGVINKEKNYLYKIDDFEFIDGVFETCRKFHQDGYLIIVITNQAGIARGLYSLGDYQKLTNWMNAKFLEHGVKISATYCCPHHPDFSGECACRKPSPGLLKTARNDFNIDMASSIFLGDKESDIEAGIGAGVGKNVLVRSGHKINKISTQANAILDSIKYLVVNNN
jgi:D-glycero-D-manno-heptose 1,7-bisphosphate phosphatase